RINGKQRVLLRKYLQDLSTFQELPQEILCIKIALSVSEGAYTQRTLAQNLKPSKKKRSLR
ncbi:14523_t:CDS:2, partial [Racocetra fulgida]